MMRPMRIKAKYDGTDTQEATAGTRNSVSGSRAAGDRGCAALRSQASRKGPEVPGGNQLGSGLQPGVGDNGGACAQGKARKAKQERLGVEQKNERGRNTDRNRSESLSRSLTSFVRKRKGQSGKNKPDRWDHCLKVLERLRDWFKPSGGERRPKRWCGGHLMFHFRPTYALSDNPQRPTQLENRPLMV